MGSAATVVLGSPSRETLVIGIYLVLQQVRDAALQ